MAHIHSKRSRSALAIVALVLAGLALAACGSSGSSSSGAGSTTTSAKAATTSSAPGGTLAAAAAAGRFRALRACLQKNGVTLPERTPGRHHAPGGLPGGAGAPKLPSGVSKAKYEAAVKKCGGLPGGGIGQPGDRYRNPKFKSALSAFAACMRSSGIPLPEPNTSGKGPIFDTKGINISSPNFTLAESKCRSKLRAAFKPSASTG
ncbi:MAG TPA: hypothetical protein VL979_00670 [Solirubrobacteraceae bacterium]|nr:hypothetical protein [Solirubrobacteraceae bacterium]